MERAASTTATAATTTEPTASRRSWDRTDIPRPARRRTSSYQATVTPAVAR